MNPENNPNFPMQGSQSWQGAANEPVRHRLPGPNMDPSAAEDLGRQMAGMGLAEGNEMYNGIALPAPRANGWSSGERGNNFQHGHHQQQRTPFQNHHSRQFVPHQGYPYQYHGNYRQSSHQTGYYPNMTYRPQQQQQPQPSYQPMNIQASEFIPKSNLSAAATEFVPRQTPRNTSSFGFAQNQQKPVRADIMYDPMEELSNAISLLEYHPGKLDLTSAHLTEVLNSSLPTLEQLENVVSTIFEKCLSEKNFRYTGTKLLDHLTNYVYIELENTTFRKALLDQCEQLHNKRKDLIQSNPKRVQSFTLFMADLFIHMGICEGDVKQRIDVLAKAVPELLSTLLTTIDKENLKTVAQTLKMCGSILEEEEKAKCDGKTPNLDQLMEHIESVAENRKKSPSGNEEQEVKKEKEVEIPDHILQMLKDLVELRLNGWGLKQSSSQQAAPLHYPSQFRPQYKNNEAIYDKSQYYGGDYGYGSAGGADYYGEGIENHLTEEEMKFMAEQLGDTTSEFDFDERSVIDPEMDPEIQAAFEEFIKTQGQM